MPKRSSRRPRPSEPDENETAYRVVQEAVEGADRKNPAAVELGRLGGLKGGKARANSLSKRRKVEIARQAAKARWAKRAK